MKAYLIILMIFVSATGGITQTSPLRIVFDITSEEIKTQEAAMRHLKLMSDTYPDSQLELVIYGSALPMVLKDQSIVSDQVTAFQGHDNVSVMVCEGTMARFGVDKTHLLAGVKTVPDGILQIVTRQQEGWGYIKEANK